MNGNDNRRQPFPEHLSCERCGAKSGLVAPTLKNRPSAILCRPCIDDVRAGPTQVIRIKVEGDEREDRAGRKLRIEKMVRATLDHLWSAVTQIEVFATDDGRRKRCRIRATLSDGHQVRAEARAVELDHAVAMALKHLAEMAGRHQRARTQRRRAP